MVAKEQLIHGPLEAPHRASRESAAERQHHLARDSRGRIWYNVHSPEARYALVEDETQRSVLTSLGQRFIARLDRDDRRRVLQDALKQRLSGELLQIWGTEGTVRKVNEVPPNDRIWIQKLVTAALKRNPETATPQEAKYTAVEKSFNRKNALSGWEMTYIIDELHARGKNPPDVVRDLSGLDEVNILQPLGGTQKKLYMPYLSGATMDDYFEWMFERDRELSLKITAALHEYTHKVRTAMYYHLLMILGDHGYQPYDAENYQYQFIHGYNHFAKKISDRQQLVLDVFIDVHPMEMHPYDRYRNWMMSEELVTECQKVSEATLPDSDKVEQIVSLIKQHAVIFDPVYIRKRKERL
jgi:hypothetical protein